MELAPNSGAWFFCLVPISVGYLASIVASLKQLKSIASSLNNMMMGRRVIKQSPLFVMTVACW